MLEKRDRFQILIAAVLVRHPLPVLLAVIQIQHRCHRIHTKPVHMIVLNPEQCIGDQEILHLRLAVVENLRPPVRMLSLSRIRIFKCRRTVKISQSMGILWKMRRYPVQDHTDAIPVQIINHIGKILRCPVTGSRRIISGYLIPPGSVKRMLCNPHQFYMSVSHLFHIICDRMCELAICIKSFLFGTRITHPGAHMYLIDRQRILLLIPLFPLLQPLLVRPLQIRNIGHSGSRTRTPLRIICKRIRLKNPFSCLCLDTEFIQIPFLRSRHKTSVDPKRLLTMHLIRPKIPCVKFTYNGHSRCMRRPYCKIDTFLLLLHGLVRSHLAEDLIVRALSEKILI